MPVMVSRPPTPRRLLKRSHALGESLEYRSAIPAIPTPTPTVDDIQLNKLAVGFEKFFWRPTEENRKHLMAAIADIRQNAHAMHQPWYLASSTAMACLKPIQRLT
jgi:hypothetical protein